ncbi:hypothetical protein [Pedosphaera parvula]|uniref:Uncharacterized protein n=1 Tax=Pedosphaera parvula (strain Ellin514) TaxID=320771 RepID=B9XMH0_PEDPL|nr:hypothetical protein [Pedosphaera parvula]EEF59012.1 hypothetical protein Cflav_PD2061 [Pedosphaera parvula Ellin514]
MQNKATRNRWFDIVYLTFIFGLAVVAGVLFAKGFHHSGRGWIGSVIIGVLFGLPFVLVGHMFLQAALRFIWLVRYIWHKSQQR